MTKGLAMAFSCKSQERWSSGKGRGGFYQSKRNDELIGASGEAERKEVRGRGSSESCPWGPGTPALGWTALKRILSRLRSQREVEN